MFSFSSAIFFLLVFDVGKSLKIYENHKEFKLKNGGKIRLSWATDWRHERVHFMVQFDQAPNFRWAAVGFSDDGKWPNTDLCLLARTPTNKWRFVVKEKFKKIDLITNGPVLSPVGSSTWIHGFLNRR